MIALEVTRPGLATTAEDLGVRGRAHQGVSRGGAFDARSLALANRAVGNAPSAMGLEALLQGPTLAARAPCTVAWCGAPFDVEVDGAPLPPLTARALAPAQALRVGRCLVGARCAVAVAGGLELARGTTLVTGMAMGVGAAAGAHVAPPLAPPMIDGGTITLRITDGLHTASFAAESVADLCASSFIVDPATDRRGVRLRGPPLHAPPSDVVSVGVSVGAVQVTPSGQMVVLGVERATTGGYPVIAHVTRVDAWLLGQLRPGAAVRFQHVAFDEARRLWCAGDRCG